MNLLKLEQVPELFVLRAPCFQVMEGSRYIRIYLAEVCRYHGRARRIIEYSPASAFDFLRPQDEGCSIDTEKSRWCRKN